MGILSSLGTLAYIVAALQAAPQTDETLAAPLNRTAPDYPASCRPAPGEDTEPQLVTVTFGVTRDGLTENIRVRETTDPCFDEMAIAAARGWIYEPRRVNGIRQSQEDLEVTFTFVWEGESQTEEFDARPISRAPPRYPMRCARFATKRETVLLEFDVTEKGRTANIHVIKSSKACFERSAKTAAAKWRYQPRLIAGKPTVRKNVQTQITFELATKTPPELKFRPAVRSKLKRVENALRRKNTDPEKVLATLAAIETEYGDTFSKVELRSFHQLRAAARIEAGDYEGALDDLRVVQRSGMSEEAGVAVGETIEQLEAAIAAQEAAAAAQAEQSATSEEADEAEEAEQDATVGEGEETNQPSK